MIRRDDPAGPWCGPRAVAETPPDRARREWV